MKLTTEIPDRMKHLRIDERGYPIPYFVPFVDGKPDFRYQDAKKQKTAMDRKLCGVCGGRLLAKQFWFISGPIGLHNKTHSDAPMHEECARFSMHVCPHLQYLKSERRSDETMASFEQLRNKPLELFLVRADKVGYHAGTNYIWFRPVDVERWIYENNRLVKEKAPSV